MAMAPPDRSEAYLVHDPQEELQDPYDSGGGGLVSIQGCTLLLCITCIAATAALCVVLAVDSADKALSAKDDMYSSALGDLTNTSRASLNNLTFAFVQSLVSTELDVVLAYMGLFARLTGSLLDDVMSWQSRGVDDTVWSDFLGALQGRLWAEVDTYFGDGLTGVGVINSHKGMTIWVFEHTYTLNNPPDGVHKLWATHVQDSPHGFYGSIKPNDGGLYYDRPCCTAGRSSCLQVVSRNETAGLPEWYDPNEPDGACPIRLLEDHRQSAHYLLTMVAVPPRTVRYSPLGTAGDYVGISAVAPWTTPDSDAKRGVLLFGADLRSISQIYAKSVRNTPGAKMRVFSLVNEDWVYDTLGPTLAQAVGHKKQTGLLTGVSHGDSAYKYRHWDLAVNCVGCQRAWARTAENASDYLIRSVAIAVNGSYAEYNFTRLIRTTAALGAEPEAFYVLSSPTVHPAGINWWLTVVIDRAYVLAAIEERIERTLAEVARGDEEVNKDLEDDRTLLFVFVAAVAAALVLVAVAFVGRINAPLKRLLAEMRHVSEMDLDSVDVNRRLSTLYEVRSMEISFRKMIDNLREFRKYMPASIVDNDGGGEEQFPKKQVLPPEGEVTLVFTDIKGSTSLWEQATEAMGVSLKLHNNIIRKSIAECDGYEVKTVGDAFFVAFQSAEDACRFGLKVQSDLNGATWPQDLAECGLIQSARIEEAGKTLYAGVRVRIGIHTGPCELEMNPMTRRADYFGPPVNIAARLEANGAAGFVAVSDAVVEAVGEGRLREICGALVPLGEKELKGVGKPIVLTGLLPKGLEGRAKFVNREGQEQFPQLVRQGDAPKPQKKLAVPERLRCTLTGTRAAVAQVCAPLQWDEETGLDGVLDCANAHVAASVLAAERTEGTLQHCAGSFILITWNAGRRCANAQEQALEFVGLLYKRLVLTPEVPSRAHIGVTGGTVVHGNVGLGGRRFATVLGGSVELAAALACLARDWRTFALCAGIGVGKARGNTRPITRWDIPEWDDVLTVSELNCAALGSRQQDDPRSPKGRRFVDREYRTAFERDDQAKFVEFAEQAPEDRVLQRLAKDPHPSAVVTAWWVSSVFVPDDAARARAGDGISSAGSRSLVSTSVPYRKRGTSLGDPRESTLPGAPQVES